MRIAEVQLYDDEYVYLPWERVEDIDVWCHEITELEAANLIPTLCGFIFIGGREQRRCDKLCIPEHQIRITEDYAWPPPHMFASIAFGCGIKLENGWLTLNADQCWCLVKKH